MDEPLTQQEPTPGPPVQQEQPSFDQIVKGNIDIKQLCNKNKVKINKYKITFNKIGKFLKYQTWSDSNETLNEHRKVYYQKAKIWIQQFNSLNASLKLSNKPLFTPTTVMEIGKNNYIFVIYEAKINFKNQVVFTVSTQDITLSSSSSTFKQLLNLPLGCHDNVRFDIDAQSPLTQPLVTTRNVLFIAAQECSSQNSCPAWIYIPTHKTRNLQIYVDSAYFLDYINTKLGITKSYNAASIFYINFFDNLILNVSYEPGNKVDDLAVFNTTDDSELTIEILQKLKTDFPVQFVNVSNPPLNYYKVLGNLQVF